MDRLAGLAPDSALAALRRQRPDVVRHLQASDEAIFRPREDGGLSPAERIAAALRVAELLRDKTLESHYRGRLVAAGAQAEPPGKGGKRWTVILAHVERVTLDPGSASRAHVNELSEAGLSPQAIVALSQLIAYVNFQSRVLAGLLMLRDAK